MAATKDAKEPKEPAGASVGDASSSYRKAGPYLDASWQLSGAVVVWTLLGWWLDRKLGTSPWLLVSGSVLGMGIGFYLFFRALAAIDKKGS